LEAAALKKRMTIKKKYVGEIVPSFENGAIAFLRNRTRIEYRIE